MTSISAAAASESLPPPLAPAPAPALALALGRPTVSESESPEDGPVLASASEDTRVLLEVDGVVLVLAAIPHCQRAVCMPVRSPCGPESAERAAVASSISELCQCLLSSGVCESDCDIEGMLPSFKIFWGAYYGSIYRSSSP